MLPQMLPHMLLQMLPQINYQNNVPRSQLKPYYDSYENITNNKDNNKSPAQIVLKYLHLNIENNNKLIQQLILNMNDTFNLCTNSSNIIIHVNNYHYLDLQHFQKYEIRVLSMMLILMK